MVNDSHICDSVVGSGPHHPFAQTEADILIHGADSAKLVYASKNTVLLMSRLERLVQRQSVFAGRADSAFVSP